jgi:hypothetical protein
MMLTANCLLPIGTAMQLPSPNHMTAARLLARWLLLSLLLAAANTAAAAEGEAVSADLSTYCH